MNGRQLHELHLHLTMQKKSQRQQCTFNRRCINYERLVRYVVVTPNVNLPFSLEHTCVLHASTSLTTIGNISELFKSREMESVLQNDRPKRAENGSRVPNTLAFCIRHAGSSHVPTRRNYRIHEQSA